MIKQLLSLAFVGVFTTLNAQNAGYDTTQFNPTFIQNNTGDISLRLGAYTQFRYNLTALANTPDSVESVPRGFNIARTRIFLEGKMTPKFNYHFRANINASNNLELMVAYLQWNVKENMYVRMGKQFMPLGREDWILPLDLAALDFSAHDFTYAIWTSYGFLFHHTPSTKFRYWLGLGNGAYGSRRAYPDLLDSDLALTARADWNIFGTDWGVYDDLLGRKGSESGVMIGIGAGNNSRYNKEALQTKAKNAQQLNVDFTATGSGYQFFVQGSVTTRQFETSAAGTNNYQWGMYGNMGYWLTNQWFGYARLDVVGKGDNLQYSEDFVSPGLGISIYPFEWTNRTRFSLEYNFVGATLANTPVAPDGQLGLIDTSYGMQQSIRFQAQFGF